MRAYERLLNYVRVHTTSDPETRHSPLRCAGVRPAHQLVEELKALGVENARVDEHCYVYGSLPATPGCEDNPHWGSLPTWTPPLMPAARTCSPSWTRTTTAVM